MFILIAIALVVLFVIFIRFILALIMGALTLVVIGCAVYVAYQLWHLVRDR